MSVCPLVCKSFEVDVVPLISFIASVFGVMSKKSFSDPLLRRFYPVFFPDLYGFGSPLASLSQVPSHGPELQSPSRSLDFGLCLASQSSCNLAFLHHWSIRVMGFLSTLRDSNRQEPLTETVLLDFWSNTELVWFWYAAGQRSHRMNIYKAGG